jgi:type I restriction enzyme S subunit
LALTHLGVPSLPEQRKIATVLYTVDQAIEKTEEIITQRERTKAGLIQDLFERGLDMDGNLRPRPSEDRSLYIEKRDRIVPPNWEVKRLADVGEWVSGKTPKRSEPSFWGGEIPWITAKDMKSLYLNDSEDNITEVAVDEGASMVSSESVLILVRGMILDHTLPVVRPERETSFNQDVKAILPHTSVNPDYLAYWLKAHSNEVLALVTSASHGTKRLATEAFGNLTITLPPLDEQTAIVERVHNMDNLLEMEESYIDRLERIKTGLIQDLLSGKVRTTDTNIQVPDEIAQYG